MKEKLPTWDLSDLFTSPESKNISATLAAGKRAAERFAKQYRGKLLRVATSPGKLLKIIREYEAALIDVLKPVEYAQLRFAECASEPERGAFLQKMKSEYLEVRNLLVFFEIELLTLPTAKLKSFARDRALAGYSNYLTKLINSKPHRLSERDEQLLEKRDLTGRGAFVRLYDEELAIKRFKFTHGKKSTHLSETEVLNLLYSPQQSVRKAAAQSLTFGLKEESRRLLYITNTLAEDKAVEDKLRNYSSPEASRHQANEINQGMVDTMSEVVTAHYGMGQGFCRFKAKVLGLKKLSDFDRYAPVVAKTTPISFATSRKNILQSFYAFSPQYGKIAQEFFDKNWIDAAARKGKRGGAFCSYATPDLHPYVFLNYSGSIRELFTLAHELGHGIHGYLMRDRGLLNADTPLTIAETASVFAEMLLFADIKKSLSKKELFSLYMGKIESIFATVFRQISMYRFEQDLHRERKNGELSIEKVNALWRTRQVEMFGDSVTLTSNYDYWWSYIPHFIHTPFYVYAYAFGELMTLSLYAQYQRVGTPFVDKYLTMLSTGGSKSPEDLLKPLGVNLNDKKFWVGGISIIQDLVGEVKRLR